MQRGNHFLPVSLCTIPFCDGCAVLEPVCRPALFVVYFRHDTLLCKAVHMFGQDAFATNNDEEAVDFKRHTPSRAPHAVKGFYVRLPCRVYQWRIVKQHPVLLVPQTQTLLQFFEPSPQLKSLKMKIICLSLPFSIYTSNRGIPERRLACALCIWAIYKYMKLLLYIYIYG